MLMHLKTTFKMEKQYFMVNILSMVFGIGAWLSINGLWVELPLLVRDLPENWSLPSYLSVITQIANIGPISYTILKNVRKATQPTTIIYAVLCIGCSSSLLLPFFWDKTTLIRGLEHSTGLMILVFFLALVDCTSSVLYIPYMVAWKDIYLPSYLIGEGLSGLIPGLVALGQGVGGNAQCQNSSYINDNGSLSWTLTQKPLKPNFSVDIFFFILFVMMVASSMAFILLEALPYIRTERCPNEIAPSSRSSIISISKSQFDKRDLMTAHTYIILLITQTLASMLMNGFMPSIQSYSSLPYGNVAYHLAATLSALANPIAAFSTMILPRARLKTILSLSFLGVIFVSYITLMAVMSPEPLLLEYKSGAALIVFSWISFIGVISYVRVEINNLMRQEGAKALFWSGALTQAGSAVGAIIAFILINKTHIFNSYNPCS